MSGLFRVSTASVRRQIRENEFYRCVFSPFVQFISIARVILEQIHGLQTNPVRVLSCVVRQFDYEYDHVRRHLRLCPLMADETDAGMEAPAPESVRRIGGVFGSSLSCPTFFFGGVGSLSFRVEGALVVNHASPGWSVLSLPCFEPVIN